MGDALLEMLLRKMGRKTGFNYLNQDGNDILIGREHLRWGRWFSTK